MLRAEHTADQQLHGSCGPEVQVARKGEENQEKARPVVRWQSDGQAQRTRTVKIMTRRVAYYLSPQSPTSTAEKHRVLLEKTSAQ
jgi:hypothetical protein